MSRLFKARMVSRRVLAEKEGKVIAVAYTVFRYQRADDGSDRSERAMYDGGFGQEVDGTYGWHCVYIAMDEEEFKDNKVLEYEGDYPELTVYGGCTYSSGGTPYGLADAMGEDFGERAVQVVGWDYNHGYTMDLFDLDEHAVDQKRIDADIDKAWEEILGGQPVCTLDWWFEYTDADGKRIYYMKSKDGQGVLPVLFCPFCGKRLE